MIFLGPSSLESNSTVRSGPKGYAYRWDLKAVTPGCIAAASVIVSGLFSLFRYYANYPKPTHLGPVHPLARPFIR